MDRDRLDTGDLPRPVRRFLARCVDAVEQLEIILLLQKHADRSWTPTDVSEALTLPGDAAARDLEVLCGRDLLDVRLGADVRYRFAPGSPELARQVRGVVDAYRASRGAVLAFVTTRRRRSLRDFSDAFKLIEHDDDR